MSYILIFTQVLLGTPKEMHEERKGENATRSNVDSMVVVQWLCLQLRLQRYKQLRVME